MAKDIYFKDEGDFITVCFQTPDAIKALRKQSKEVQDVLHGSDNYKKLDIAFDMKSMLVGWAMSENLSWESETPITINNGWCKCEGKKGIYFVDDDVHPVYKKHHWRCSKCKKITQIG